MNNTQGWLDHVADGGAQTWEEFTGGATPTHLGSYGGRPVGAQQVELARRVNAAGGQCAAEILSAPLVGRGMPEQPLGTRVRAAEEVRVAAALWAARATAAAAAHHPPVSPRLLGDPHLVAHARPTWWGKTVWVDSLDRVLASVWIARCQRPVAPSWAKWWAAWAQRGTLPPQADLAALLRRHKRARVRGPRPDSPDRLGAGAAELLRHVSATLAVRVPAAEHSDRVALVTDWFAPLTSPALRAPDAHAPWLALMAEQQRDAIRQASQVDVGELRTDGELPSARSALQAATTLLAGGAPGGVR